jgi:hypothetical protein
MNRSAPTPPMPVDPAALRGVRSSKRVRAARGPATLDQLPVWAGFGPLAGAAAEVEPGLEALLRGLNPEQRRAVTHGDGPMLVVAGPGTGKTEVITRRIAWLIATRRAMPS